ncbi:MAG: response regulator transcription factor, partial [Anaerolineales bacterium]|nr:response regulator transcription factor [Anaerolineales bacterium]
QRSLIRLAMDSGASGYILKDDHKTLQDLEAVVRSVAQGGKYFSHEAYELLTRQSSDDMLLTPRQLETLSLCIAYPNETTAQIAQRLKISDSTVRSLLSEIYKRLDVSTRTAAIAKARHLGLISSIP